MNNDNMICDMCGRDGARVRKVTEAYGKRKDLLVIENIPMVSCPHCRESYFTAETLHEIERIISDPRKTPLDVLDQINRKNNALILSTLKIRR